VFAWTAATTALSEVGLAERFPAATGQHQEVIDGGATLKTNPELERYMLAAERKAQDGRFDLAAILWQRVLDESSGTLMTNRAWVRDVNGKRYQVYRAVVEQIERTLGKLPPEGRAVYLLTADGEAQAVLADKEGKSEEELLSEVARRFFLSSQGDDAAYRLACMSLDRHDFVGAGRWLAKVLNEHPDPSMSKDDLLLRLAVAHGKVGDVDAAERVLALLEKSPTRPSSRIIDSVRQYIKQDGVTVGSPTNEIRQWPMRFGNASRTGRMPTLPGIATESDLTELWSQAMEQKPYEWLDDKPGVASETGLRSTTTEGTRFAIPGSTLSSARYAATGGHTVDTVDQNSDLATVVAKWRESTWRPTNDILLHNGRIYFKTRDRLVCCDAATGETVWKSLWSNEFVMDGMSSIFMGMGHIGGNRPRTRREVRLFGDRVQQSMSIANNAVYTIEGRAYLPGESPPPNETDANRARMMRSRGATPRRSRANFLTAFEADTGKLLWRRSAHDSKATANYEVGFLAAPTPYGRLLLAPISDSGSLYLAGLDRDTGETAWKTYLCDDPPGGAPAWSRVAVAVDGGDAYVLGGIGVVFAVDAMSGDIRWAVRYDPEGEPNMTWQQHFGHTGAQVMNLDGWEEDIVIPSGKTLVVMPSDYNYIFAVDRRTGQFQWHSPRDDCDYCLGVSDGSVYVAGRREVRRYSMRGGMLKRVARIDESFGRGVVTADAIYVPVKDSIVKLDAVSLETLDQVGVSLPYYSPVGNLFSDGEKLIMASPAGVCALTNLEYRLQQLAKLIDEGDTRACIDRMQLRQRLKDPDGALNDLRLAYQRLLKTESREAVRGVLYPALADLKTAKTRPQTTANWLANCEGLDGELIAADYELQPDSTGDRARILARVLQTARTSPDAVKLESLLALAPLCESYGLRQLAAQAVATVAEQEDAGVVRSSLAAEHPMVRLLALHAGISLSDAGAEYCVSVLNDSDEQVRFAAARELADQGDRRCLMPLVELLASDSAAMRSRANSTLTLLTGAKFAYVPTAPLEERIVAGEAWRNWVVKHGGTAKLRYPLAKSGVVYGRTLVCFHSANRVVEYDASGQELWSKPVPQPWCARGLTNGHRLIASFADRAIYEYDAAGEEIVWKLVDLPGSPAFVQRLKNGNTLVAMPRSQLVCEYDLSGAEVGRAKINGSPHDARRLDNGNMLVALLHAKQVVEISPRGKTVWTAKNMARPFSADRLDNGRTLIALSEKGGVIEIDRGGKVHWSVIGLSSPFFAQRLPNGETLVVDSRGVHEYDNEGKLGKTICRGTVVRAHRY
jgi:outer membrane protein assembly factor BamB